MESIEVKLARVEENLSSLREEIRTYHKEVSLDLRQKVEGHGIAITILRRDRWWISTLSSLVFSFLGSKLFGKQ